MSVFGVDFGTLNSVVAVTRHGGIDVVCNEVSKRETATYVSYMGDERLIGEAGFDKLVRNPNNTVPCVKHLIGLRSDDARYKSEMRFVNCHTGSDAEGKLQLEMEYDDKTVSLYPEQILTAFVGQLRKYVCIETKTDARDCVVSVPVWYTAEQRRLVMQACTMAGLSCLSLINETTAASVDYGIFRGSTLAETEEGASTIAVVDLGYAGATVTVSKFWKGNMKVLAHTWDLEVGTREIDWALYEHFAKEVQTKYKIDVTENKRARIRLLQGCDKLKCMLSANAVAPLNIENLMDVDIAFMFTREQLEPIITPLLERLKTLARRALERAGVESVVAVEVIGGGSRVPAFKQAVSDGFNLQAGFTLNASEAIARGCAITAATFSPLFQVREYVVNEAPLCPLYLGYHSEKTEASSAVAFLPDVNKTMPLLRDTDRYPKTIELTFQRSEPFTLYAFYDEAHPDAKYVPTGKRSIVGKWLIGGPPQGKTVDGSVKVRVKFHASGLVTIDAATTHETYETEVDEVVKDETKKEGEAAAPDAKPKTQKVKKSHRKRLELTVTSQHEIGLDAKLVEAGTKLEHEMDTRDISIQRTREVRNELEGYVYDNRPRINDGDLSAFVTDADRKSFVTLAAETEEWLYGDGDNAPLQEYQVRLDKLKVVGSAALRRMRLSEDIPFAHRNFENKVNILKETATAKIGKAAHITNEELQGAIAKADEALAWGRKELEAYQAKPRYEEPSLAPTTFDNKAKEIESAVNAVVNKKPPPPPKKEEKKPDDAKKDAKDASASPPPASESTSPKGPDAPAELD
jgi:molecular chaperone DnaK (HSP70)